MVTDREHPKSYSRELSAANSATYTDAATRALDAVAEIGSAEEREETAQLLLDALAASRLAEGRPF